MTDREVDILDLLAALNAGKKLIIAGTLSICILTGIVGQLMEDEYEATVQLLPPKEQKAGFGFADLLAQMPIPSLRLGEKGTPADIFVAILKSPTMKRQLVEDFNLMDRYEAELRIDAIKALERKTEIGKSEQGTIMISVLDRDPVMAADIANRYVALLDGEIEGERGCIELSFRLDLDNRPRQIHDEVHGKLGITHEEHKHNLQNNGMDKKPIKVDQYFCRRARNIKTDYPLMKNCQF